MFRPSWSSSRRLRLPKFLYMFISSFSFNFYAYLHMSVYLFLSKRSMEFLSSSSHLYSEMKTSRVGTGKGSLFIQPDYVMPSLLAFLLRTKAERFSRLAVDFFNAITGRTVSTGWMGLLPASLADTGRGKSHTASSRIQIGNLSFCLRHHEICRFGLGFITI